MLSKVAHNSGAADNTARSARHYIGVGPYSRIHGNSIPSIALISPTLPYMVRLGNFTYPPRGSNRNGSPTSVSRLGLFECCGSRRRRAGWPQKQR